MRARARDPRRPLRGSAHQQSRTQLFANESRALIKGVPMVSENLVFRSRSRLPHLSLAAILVAASGLVGCKDKKQPPPQAVRGADQSAGWVIEEDTTAPELNAASLMQLKGIAVYRAGGTMVPPRNTVA